VEVALSSKGQERVHGVGRSPAAELDVRDGEARVLADGQLGHPEPMLHRRQFGRGLVGRHRGRHEEDAVEGQGLAELVGEEQVAEVNRVERAPEDANPGHRARYSRT